MSKERYMEAPEPLITPNIRERFMELQARELKDPAEDEYRDETGTIRCKTCKEERRSMVPICTDGPECIRRRQCKCDREAAQKRLDEEYRLAQAERKRKIEERRAMGIPQCHWEDTFENNNSMEKDETLVALKYAQNFKKVKRDGASLILYGDVGTGKSFLALNIANKVVDQGYTAKFATLNEIIMQVGDTQPGKKDKYFKGLAKFDLLVIDDFGTERDTSYANETVFRVINDRYERQKPTIITTNLDKSELENPTDIEKKRLMSRLLERAMTIDVQGPDRRALERKKATETKRIMEWMLDD